MIYECQKELEKYRVDNELSYGAFAKKLGVSAQMLHGFIFSDNKRSTLTMLENFNKLDKPAKKSDWE